MNKLNHLEKERKDGRKQDRAAVPTEFQTSTQKKQKTGVLGGGVSAATDTISHFRKSNKKKNLVGKKRKGTGGTVVQILQKHWHWTDTSAVGSILRSRFLLCVKRSPTCPISFKRCSFHINHYALGSSPPPMLSCSHMTQ